jgi:hypothetical protein
MEFHEAIEAMNQASDAVPETTWLRKDLDGFLQKRDASKAMKSGASTQEAVHPK